MREGSRLVNIDRRRRFDDRPGTGRLEHDRRWHQTNQRTDRAPRRFVPAARKHENLSRRTLSKTSTFIVMSQSKMSKLMQRLGTGKLTKADRAQLRKHAARARKARARK